MSIEAEPIARMTFGAAELLKAHPPKLQNRNKQAVFEIACPQGIGGAGSVIYSRWWAMSLPGANAESMRLTQPTGGENQDSRIVNSEGARDTEAWGKRAKWCDYSGLVDGKRVGIALFDHPQNPRFPTWWMVRDYGLFAANPFGQHEFEKLSNANVGDLRIPAGQSVTFRYRILFHSGSAEEARLAERFEQFAAEVR